MKKFTLVAIAAASLFVVGCNKTEGEGNTTPDPSASGKMTPAPSPAMSPDTSATPTTPDAGGVTEADLGVPFYPGSTDKGMGSSKTEANGMVTVGSMRTTSDPADKVIAFYKDEITKAGYTATSATTAAGATVGGMKGKDVIGVTVTKDPTGSGNLITIGLTKPK